MRTDGQILTWTNTACMGLAFATLIPPAKIPEALRPLADYQPIAPAAAAMRALSNGGAFWQPLAVASLWMVVIAAVMVPMAVRSYRAAVEGGKVDG